jgi:hypothetical protein
MSITVKTKQFEFSISFDKAFIALILAVIC